MDIDELKVIEILDDDEETTFSYLHMVTITMEVLNNPTGLSFIPIYRKLLQDFEKMIHGKSRKLCLMPSH